ncbi:TlpA family protein disulfide reductase [Clostridium sardiniense]|uniref:TlpA family protein disulfide reductase n=1 Tax=Clostridium sardiniense TaxID=29369 RepID=A0ABS7KUE3_CLOSR|nr:TlpA disulfide reductase family protein [Clostridium sardiniense]MBY0754435.1 TlpA family protein disulfide reductase [Clostridium sardiniense]MDQ0461312.1 thiol-disulfide isomerase/thioredoxin [Clostridium sardiniense]
MNEKKRLIYIIIVFVALIAIGGVSYKYLSNKYSKSQIENQMPKQGSIGNEANNNINNVTKAPDFTVYNEEGKAVKLSDYKGKKAVVVNFWASWCPPCKYEMPYFQKAKDKYEGKEVEILMVNLTDGSRETKKTALEFMKESKYNMNVLFDTELNAAKIYGIQALPRTLFIDKDGNLVNDHTGLITQDMLDDNIDDLIRK